MQLPKVVPDTYRPLWQRHRAMWSSICLCLALGCTPVSSAATTEADLDIGQGGASGQWRVDCGRTSEGAASTAGCILFQQVVTPQGQRVLDIHLRPDASGAQGAVILPFGLSMAAGVQLQIDNSKISAPLSFRTCLPAGCLIELDFDNAALEALRAGKTLTIRARGAGEAARDVVLPVTLDGFSAAYTQAAEGI